MTTAAPEEQEPEAEEQKLRTVTPYERRLARLEAEKRKLLDKLTAATMGALGASSGLSQALDLAGLVAMQAEQHHQHRQKITSEAQAVLMRAREELAAAELRLERAQARQTEAAAEEAMAKASVAAMEAEKAAATAHIDPLIESLRGKLERLDHRFRLHVARGPGSSALYVGANTPK